MNRDFVLAQDFNQMLVASVFFHLLFIVAWMFLPKPKLQSELVVPAFMVSLEEIPGAPLPSNEALSQENLSNKLKPLPIKNKVKSDVPKTEMDLLIKQLNLLSGKKEKKSIVEQLEFLAKATIPKKIAPLKKNSKDKKALRKKEPDPIQKQIAEKSADSTKSLRVDPYLEIPNIELPENLSAGLQELKAEKLSEPAIPPVDESHQYKADNDSKYAKLSNISELQPSTMLNESNYENLLQDLETLKGKQNAPDLSIEKKTEIKINKKLQVDKEVEAININSRLEVSSNEFVSQIRATKASSSAVSSKMLGGESSNPLALYTGQVKSKIDSNWKIPLGIEHEEEILVAFFIFSGGNIGKPQLQNSSGIERLDAMAIKAVLDSAPFPEFEKNLMDYLKEPNLHIKMRFKLTPNIENEKLN